MMDDIQTYLIALGGLVAGLIITRLILRIIVSAVLNWTSRPIPLVDFLQRHEPTGRRLIQVIILKIAMLFFDLPPRAESIANIIFVLLIIFFSTRFLGGILKLLVRGHFGARTEQARQLQTVWIIVDLLLWTFSTLFFLSYLGYNVSAILAGLGIGGIAIALAAQNILGDLFNYFVILFDRPFEAGDFIIVDDKKGTIEHIGLKTTRIRALDGEQLVVANSDLTQSRIHNYKKMEQRRVAFTIRVPFTTGMKMLKEIPVFVREAIESNDEVIYDRANLISIGEYSFHFEIVYIILKADYNFYASVQERINLKILAAFRQADISLALPVRDFVLSHVAPPGGVIQSPVYKS